MFILQSSTSIKKQKDMIWSNILKPIFIIEVILLLLSVVIYFVSMITESKFIHFVYNIMIAHHLYIQWLVLTSIIIYRIGKYFYIKRYLAKEERNIELKSVDIDNDKLKSEELKKPSAIKNDKLIKSKSEESNEALKIKNEIILKNQELNALIEQVASTTQKLKDQEAALKGKLTKDFNEQIQHEKEQIEAIKKDQLIQIEQQKDILQKLENQVQQLTNEIQESKAKMQKDKAAELHKQKDASIKDETAKLKSDHEARLVQLQEDQKVEQGNVRKQIKKINLLIGPKQQELSKHNQGLEATEKEINEEKQVVEKYIAKIKMDHDGKMNVLKQQKEDLKNTHSQELENMKSKFTQMNESAKQEYEQEMDGLRNQNPQVIVQEKQVIYDTLFEEAMSSAKTLINSKSILYNKKSIPQILVEFIIGKCGQYHTYSKTTLVDCGDLHIKPLYRYHASNKALFHAYCDDKPLILICIKITNGPYIIGFSAPPFKDPKKHKKIDDIYNQPGLMFDVTAGKIFTLKKDERPIIYDEYFVIWGESDIRIKAHESKLYAQTAHSSSYECTDDARPLLDKELHKELIFHEYDVQFDDYELYQCSLRDTDLDNPNTYFPRVIL